MKRPLLWLITPLFSLLLFATAFNYGFAHIIGNPEQVKKILKDSHVYDNVVSGALAQAKTVSSGQGDVSLNDPIIKSAAEKSFSPQVVEDSTNKIIDGIYAWLNGKAPAPTFSIDLSPVKTNFANNVAGSLQQRLASLPKCTTVPTGSFDPVTADCLPPGVTPEAGAQQAKEAILSGQGFLDHPVITSDSVKSDGSNQSVFTDQLKSAPGLYQKAKKAPAILALLSILVAAAIIFLSPTRTKGLHKVGITLLTIAVVMIVFGWLLDWAIHNKVLPNIKFDNALLQSDVKKLVTDITDAIKKNYWMFGGIYALLGVAALLGPRFLNKQPQTIPAADQTPAAPAAEQPQDSPRPANNPKSVAKPTSSKPRKIQG